MLTSWPASPERPSVDQKKSTHAKFCASHSHDVARLRSPEQDLVQRRHQPVHRLDVVTVVVHDRPRPAAR